MSNFLEVNSIESEWQNLVSDAAKNCHQHLDEDLESYLVFALIRSMRNSSMSESVLALEYMRASEKSGQEKYQHLRDLGDKCLLFSGLFPQSSQRKLVNLGYYINIGISSYSQIGDIFHNGFAKLYERLARCFITLTDVLHSMRELCGTPVMTESEKYSFWIDFNSQYAHQSLKDYYGVIPFKPKS